MLTGYSVFEPPHDGDVADLDPRAAKRYFDWFVDQIPFRMQQLRRYSSECDLDNSSSSLGCLGDWLGKLLTVVPRTDERMAAVRASVPDYIQGTIASYDLSLETVSLSADVGIYLAVTLQAHHPSLHWDYIKKPKSMADLNQPSLFGFGGGDFLNPVRIGAVLVHKMADGVSGGKELTRLYDVWESNVAECHWSS